MLCVSAGFILTALDIFSPSAARGAGQLILVRRRDIPSTVSFAEFVNVLFAEHYAS